MLALLRAVAGAVLVTSDLRLRPAAAACYPVITPAEFVAGMAK